MTDRRYAVVAGGGTGGHVLPALSVARALVDRGHEPSTIEFLGSTRGDEGPLLAGEGFPFELLAGRGLVRRLRPADLAQNARSLVAVAGSCVTAVAALGRWRPRVVVAVGGYASFPAGLAAVVRRVPLVVVNIDAVPGLTNRILGRFAAACAVGFPDTPLRRAVVTGAPVRPDIAAADRSPEGRRQARRALGLPPDRPTLAAFGGSLGARRINRAVLGLGQRWAGRPDRALYHVTGRRDHDEMAAAAGSDPAQRLVAYEDRMPLLYAAADLVVCRAGATTVAELAVAGVPAVLVPLPGAPGDHQTANARQLVRAGAAVLVPDDQCDTERLGRVVDELLGDPERLEGMGSAARALGHPDAAARVAEVVDRHAR